MVDDGEDATDGNTTCPVLAVLLTGNAPGDATVIGRIFEDSASARIERKSDFAGACTTGILHGRASGALDGIDAPEVGCSEELTSIGGGLSGGITSFSISSIWKMSSPAGAAGPEFVDLRASGTRRIPIVGVDDNGAIVITCFPPFFPDAIGDTFGDNL